MLSDEQMSKRLPVSLLNDEQMSNWVGVKHLPVNLQKKPSIFRKPSYPHGAVRLIKKIGQVGVWEETMGADEVQPSDPRGVILTALGFSPLPKGAVPTF